jgi:uncharacterized protein (TIGR04255 family)
MRIREIFPNPTVKEVIFQIRFPNLFYIEDKIGEYQLKIMNKFPNSALLFRKHLFFVDTGPDVKEDSLKLDEGKGAKIWQFESPKKYKLNVLSDSLDITSEYHKTYDLGEGEKFRDIIEFALDNFFEIVKLPIITRIGLRYIDECPIPEKNNKSFIKYYNSTFSLKRFNIEDALEMQFISRVKRNDYYLRYVESLKLIQDSYKLILDFDGYAENILPNDYLSTTDKLHDLISEEFFKTIKKPVVDYMRTGRIV